ncbi:hypothetical protein BO70DRAFT_393073 [Aspergillus heteromorphus CBS 117.55]|uniref:Serine hydrolase domain-containing protein n=1 Tax=Aspergillus heteromorphus CBS 117.55 TaxID=1448321 RepID=A0A317WTY6_9EURO|nr:uncharacterized protein BO70DRAFT_393073 [Aspergillus heteromorphus CBS 117.55]PWY89874.1 hypothetical protein BO70DRAFT_393073 [Aspergillus heteromorphus CBS 117.55]
MSPCIGSTPVQALVVTMKILCLHGHGTNAAILQYQLSGVINLADPSWEFHYLTGEVDCPPAPGITDNFPGPYRCYTRRFDPASEGAAHDLIDDTIDEQGPFDGVLGFSQGAAIAVSYLLEHQAQQPDKPLPFRFAVFCSSTVPCAADRVYSQTVLGCLSPEEEQHLRSGQDERIAQLPKHARTAISTLIETLDQTAPITQQHRSFYLDRPLAEIPCVRHPELCATRLAIPTLHVRGKTEQPEIKHMGQLVEAFCLTGKRRSWEHSAGHDLPRSGGEAGHFLSGVEWVVGQMNEGVAPDLDGSAWEFQLPASRRLDVTSCPVGTCKNH